VEDGAQVAAALEDARDPNARVLNEVKDYVFADGESAITSPQVITLSPA
jgi:hypothetical protein